MRIAVTGGAGRIGEAVLRELLEHGYEVRCIDKVLPEKRLCPSKIADLTDMGQAVDVLRGTDAVVHLAAIPSAGAFPNPVVFAVNVTSHYNVLEAASILGIPKVVTASSIQVISQLLAEKPVWPSYFPVDEEHPIFPSNCYGLAKQLGEETNRLFARQSGLQALSLRFTWVTTVEQVRGLPPDRGSLPDFWSYVDVRDAASVCRLGVEADGLGAEPFYISAADSVRKEPTADLVRAHFPDAEIRPGLQGHMSCFDIGKARRLLGYEPQFSWRDE